MCAMWTKQRLLINIQSIFQQPVLPNRDMNATFEFINAQFKNLKEEKNVKKTNYRFSLKIKEHRLMIEPLAIDESIEWQQQTIISSNESVIQTVK